MRAELSATIKSSRAALHVIQAEPPLATDSSRIEAEPAWGDAAERQGPDASKEKAISSQFAYGSGRTVLLEAGQEERLIVSNPEGALELTIRFTPEGPVLSFTAKAIGLENSGIIKMSSESLHIQTRKHLTMDIGGSLQQTVGQQISTHAQGPLLMESRRTEIKTALGDISLEANDDVRIQGERIRMNC
ncbi:MAG TPA: hypothetical protein PKI03_20745 [Pseudomonadota bacterium]|nr:hypothetical protein [Pseudomonadota bacterium]